MDERAAGRLWDANADAWTKLAREGWDIYRDFLNTPAFLAMLPDVGGLSGLDIGCGEGHNTRLLAGRGARLAAIDIAPAFVRHAVATERAQPRGITYCVGTASALPFAAASFDFATAFMSLMDMPDPAPALREVRRVLKRGGFLQFSISHPCFDTPHRRNLRDANGRTYAIEVGDYYVHLDGQVTEWLFKAAPAAAKAGLRKFQTPRFTRTLSEWMNALIDAGFAIERVEEPRPDDATVRACPRVQDAQVVSYFLHIRARCAS